MLLRAQGRKRDKSKYDSATGNRIELKAQMNEKPGTVGLADRHTDGGGKFKITT